MRVFGKAVVMNLKVYMAYPKGLLLSILIHPFILILNIFLFTSIYEHNGTTEIMGYTLTQMIWYFAATIIVWIFIFSMPDRRMSNYILSGDLGVLLLRPISIFRFELASAIALRIAGIICEFIPDIIIYSLIYPPTFLTLLSFIKFLAVIIPAFLLLFLLNYMIGMTAIITQTNAGLNRLIHTAIILLGGAVTPLEFFPNWLQRVCDVLPFKYIFYMPVQIFLNRGTAAEWDMWLTTIAFQLFWVVILYLICKLAWHMLVRKIVVAGG